MARQLNNTRMRYWRTHARRLCASVRL